LPRDASGLEVRKGRDLITATYAYIGPDVADASNRYAGNNLACSNCHPEAGTKKFGLPLFGLYSDFPQYSVRTGGEISIQGSDFGYVFPPLWGPSTFNDSAGMARIITLYVKVIDAVRHVEMDEVGGLSGFTVEAGGHALRALRGPLQRASTQIWAVPANRGRDRAAPPRAFVSRSVTRFSELRCCGRPFTGAAILARCHARASMCADDLKRM
jgi:hypothetical protein